MAAIVLAAAASSAATSLGAGTFFAAVAGGVGGFAGSFIDNKIFGRNIHQEGSRLTNLMVQASTYGSMLPVIYGQARIAGNVIWSLPLQEHASTTTQSAGGKGGGGGSVSTTTYTYTASLAVAICEGPITEIVRVWADAELIDTTQAANGSYTLYYGDEAQSPDPFMSTFYPAGQTPGYRGMAYVVIQNFPLENFGNRIPNFTFEVKRIIKLPGGLEDKITDITIIPGAGEYVYDTVVQSKTSGQQTVSGAFVQGGKTETINQHNLASKADVLVALDDLKINLPNIQFVSVVVNWFADSQNPASLTIKPGAEFNGQGAVIAPDDWAVDVFTRATAHQILTFSDGTPTFGGTPTDKSIIRLCQELKNRGYKVMFYPQLQVDTITPNAKPWRGRITPASTSDVTNFFTSTYGYNYFINHYANLQVGGVYLKNLIDAFMIGSELVALTDYMPSSGVFPAVTQLVSLAASVKTAVGSGVKVTYGADWSEYHSVGGWYHLDPLWASSSIDMVAVDCYFPLTPDLPQNQIDYNAVYNGWTSGEGWDYYYTDAVNRTGKTNFSGATYAWKNVKNWWTTTHTNPDSTTTAWTSRMKPLWFTELGFPSVDGCSNQPNVFYDPYSIESLYRQHEEPMQVISGRLDVPTVHFEAPPSKRVYAEMEGFVSWFNNSVSLPALTRASIAHLYFVSIHPFEDGNGRIGRCLVEKSLAQSLGRPITTGLSHVIHAQRKQYYAMLELSNKTNQIDAWLEYFSGTILDAQTFSIKLVEFIIQKTHFYDRFRDRLNSRQQKVIARMFREGIDGFKGGLSAENYISITGTSRATATRDLSDLTVQGAFTKTGAGKGTRYALTLE